MALGWLLHAAAPPLCWDCGGIARSGAPLCAGCRGRLRWLGPAIVDVAGLRTWAPVAYEGPARALVGGLKFRGAAGLAEAMAAQVVASVPPALLEGAALVPVPLSPGRLRRRGFNQAERLAAAVASRESLPIAACLERRAADRSQVGLPRAARLAAVRDAIAAAPGVEVPRHALLVDDVVTTGGTLAACARALRAAGTRDVAAVAYARTLGR